MQIELADRDKVDMLFIGNLHFTFENPGPFDIELDKFSAAEKNAIIYNVRRGILKVDDLESLKQATIGSPGASPTFSTATEAPIPSDVPIDLDGYLKIQLKNLKNFLKGGVTTVKKEAVRLPPEELRKLLELETQGQSRKTLVSFLEELLDKHQQMVIARVGTEDLVSMIPGIGNLDNITDVVESEVEEVRLTSSEIEEGQEVLEEDTLNLMDS